MTRRGENKSFKRAIYASLFAHLALFLLILVSPSLPKSSKKGMIHYIPLNLVAPGGGAGRGGGGGGTPLKATPPPAKKETLRDLTTPQKAQRETKSSMRYPVEKPKKEPKQKTEKKAAITKPEPSPPEESAKEGAGSGDTGSGGPGMGTGLRIGTGSGSGGPGYGGSSGLANFPYVYYLQIITDRVSANWFTSLVDPGVSGNFQTVIFFRINRNGQVSELKVEESSGLTPLDLSALRAVKASSPFPPLPRDYEDSYLVIHLIFEHSK